MIYELLELHNQKVADNVSNNAIELAITEVNNRIRQMDLDCDVGWLRNNANHVFVYAVGEDADILMYLNNGIAAMAAPQFGGVKARQYIKHVFGMYGIVEPLVTQVQIKITTEQLEDAIRSAQSLVAQISHLSKVMSER